MDCMGVAVTALGPDLSLLRTGSFTSVQIRAKTRTEHHHPHLVAFYSHFA